jgi:acid phosphatase
LESRFLLAAVPRPDHVVVVIEENRAFSNIIGYSGAPYINSLASEGALLTSYYAITHPSQPNYLALFSGSTQGVDDDSVPHTFTAPSLGGELISAGFDFAGYSEDLPAVGFSGISSGRYRRRHAPWTNFTDVPATDNVPFGHFPVDLHDLPDVSFVIPNQDHNMHDGSRAAGDAWLRDHLDPYVQWAKRHNSLFILTWDEDDTDEPGNHIVTLLVGPMVRPGRYDTRLDHYNLLRAIEDMYALPRLGNSAAAAPIDVWSTLPRVVGRGAFYNHSALDGNNAGANPADDAAVVPDKWALLPGEVSSGANSTGYSRGINGVMVDVANLGGRTPSAADFRFEVSGGGDTPVWIAAPAPSSVTVRRGAGAGGADRVTLVWADGRVKNQWLRVTVVASGNTGLAAADVFHFGNLIGDTNGDGTVNGTDFATLAGSFGRTVTPFAPADFDGDGAVAGSDFAVLAANFGRALPPLHPV